MWLVHAIFWVSSCWCYGTPSNLCSGVETGGRGMWPPANPNLHGYTVECSSKFNKLLYTHACACSWCSDWTAACYVSRQLELPVSPVARKCKRVVLGHSTEVWKLWRCWIDSVVRGNEVWPCITYLTWFSSCWSHCCLDNEGSTVVSYIDTFGGAKPTQYQEWTVWPCHPSGDLMDDARTSDAVCRMQSGRGRRETLPRGPHCLEICSDAYVHTYPACTADSANCVFVCHHVLCTIMNHR
jgi:hypothetical protein